MIGWLTDWLDDWSIDQLVVISQYCFIGERNLYMFCWIYSV